jgi:hypothetical protein
MTPFPLSFIHSFQHSPEKIRSFKETIVVYFVLDQQLQSVFVSIRDHQLRTDLHFLQENGNQSESRSELTNGFSLESIRMIDDKLTQVLCSSPTEMKSIIKKRINEIIRETPPHMVNPVLCRVCPNSLFTPFTPNLTFFF